MVRPFPQGWAPENGRTKTGTHPSARRPCIAAGARKERPSAVVEKGREAQGGSGPPARPGYT